MIVDARPRDLPITSTVRPQCLYSIHMNESVRIFFNATVLVTNRKIRRRSLSHELSIQTYDNQDFLISDHSFLLLIYMQFNLRRQSRDPSTYLRQNHNSSNCLSIDRVLIHLHIILSQICVCLFSCVGPYNSIYVQLVEKLLVLLELSIKFILRIQIPILIHPRFSRR